MTQRQQFQPFFLNPGMGAIEVGRKIARGMPRTRIAFQPSTKKPEDLDVLLVCRAEKPEDGTKAKKASMKLGAIEPSKTKPGRFRLSKNLRELLYLPKTAGELGWHREEAKIYCQKLWKEYPKGEISLNLAKRILVEVRRERKAKQT